MINFDSLTLKFFRDENINFFIGARIQKIQQPNRNELIFFIRNNGETRKFYINFNPNFYHICFMSKENELKRNISIPKTAPMFCMLLRKYLLNTKIVNAEVPKYERIFEIYFEYFDELNEKTLLCLAIELMGKHSNVILYNYDTNVIIGCAHNVSSEKSRERELSGLLPYVYPPKQRKKNLLKTNFETFENEITQENYLEEIPSKYNYITKSIVFQIQENLNEFSKKVLYEELKNFLMIQTPKPCIKNDFSFYSIKNFAGYFVSDSINAMTDTYFAHHQAVYLMNNLKSKVKRYISNQLKKLKTLEQNQIMQINKIDKAIEYKNKADILTANFYNIQPGKKSVKLLDFANNDIVIELDENLSVIENANKLYSLYKKSKSANEHAQLLIKETKNQILYFEEMEFFAENSNSLEELEDIYNEISENKTEKEKTEEKIDFIELMGFKIYIGKNKKQNDYILSKLSTGEDLWFHPLNAPGAHIIVKSARKNVQIPDEVLLKAAQLTKEYSSQKNNSKTSVIYTKRKYVKKANNKLAFVTYKNEEEIII